MVLMTLSVLGFAQLVVSHERLVSTLDAWCRDDPKLFVVVPNAPFERVVGVPARLSATKPVVAPAPAREPLYRVTVRSRTKQLVPPRAEARVLVEPLE